MTAFKTNFVATHIDTPPTVNVVSELNLCKKLYKGKTVLRQRLRHKKGNTTEPYFLAIEILIDFVYWYTLSKEGKKRFKPDKLQKSYAQIAETMAVSPRVATRAVKFLKEYGLITTELRNIKTSEGKTLQNVMYIDLVVDNILFLVNSDDFTTLETLPVHTDQSKLLTVSSKPARGVIYKELPTIDGMRLIANNIPTTIDGTQPTTIDGTQPTTIDGGTCTDTTCTDTTCTNITFKKNKQKKVFLEKEVIKNLEETNQDDKELEIEKEVPRKNKSILKPKKKDEPQKGEAFVSKRFFETNPVAETFKLRRGGYGRSSPLYPVYVAIADTWKETADKPNFDLPDKHKDLVVKLLNRGFVLEQFKKAFRVGYKKLSVNTWYVTHGHCIAKAILKEDKFQLYLDEVEDTGKIKEPEGFDPKKKATKEVDKRYVCQLLVEQLSKIAQKNLKKKSIRYECTEGAMSNIKALLLTYTPIQIRDAAAKRGADLQRNQDTKESWYNPSNFFNEDYLNGCFVISEKSSK